MPTPSCTFYCLMIDNRHNDNTYITMYLVILFIEFEFFTSYLYMKETERLILREILKNWDSFHRKYLYISGFTTSCNNCESLETIHTLGTLDLTQSFIWGLNPSKTFLLGFPNTFSDQKLNSFLNCAPLHLWITHTVH